MKSNLIVSKPTAEVLKFPLLAKATNSDYVVLFTSIDTGMVVCSGDRGIYGTGHYADSWTNVTDKESWIILPVGTKIELVQE